MKKLRRKEPPVLVTMPARVLWSSESGRFAVVEGPFPGGMVRSLTAPTMFQASMHSPETLEARPGTSGASHYALVFAEHITATHNEDGEICP